MPTKQYDPDMVAKGRIFTREESLTGGLGPQVAVEAREDATVLQRMAMLEKKVAVLQENEKRLSNMLSHIARTLGI